MVTALAIFAVMFLLSVLWLVRGGVARTNEPGSPGRLHQIDLPAFRNLLSAGDDAFLRSLLSPVHYRQVRRARLRAVQEYLVWIAEDCFVLNHMLKSHAQIEQSITWDTASLIRSASKIRLISSVLWVLLWGEYFFAGLKIQPFRLLKQYEEFRTSAGVRLRLQTEAH